MSNIEPANTQPRLATQSADLTSADRIPAMLDMMRVFSQATDPPSVLHAFTEAMRKHYGPKMYIAVTTQGLGRGQYRIRWLCDDDGREHVAPVEPSDLPSTPIHDGGILAQVVQSKMPQRLGQLNVPEDPVLGDLLAPYRSMLTVPTFAGGKSAEWVVLLARQPEFFTVDQVERAILRVNLLASMIRNVETVQALRHVHARMQHEVERIAAIQRTLLPYQIPEIEGLTIAAAYETFDTAGGDMYAVHPLDRGARGPTVNRGDPRWLLLIADVAGHGPAVAVVMAMLHSILHAYSGQYGGPADLFRYINGHLCRKQIEDTFVTAFLAFYNPASRTLEYALAGHPPPLLADADPQTPRIQRIEKPLSLPLGIFPDVDYEQASIDLRPGQILLLYTDGITEAHSPEGRLFGMAGLQRVLSESAGSADETIKNITREVGRHEAGGRPWDDQTLVAVQVQRAAAGSRSDHA